MARRSHPTPKAGGFLLIAALMGGVVIGSGQGQPMAGAVIGLAVGVALALLVWLIDRRR